MSLLLKDRVWTMEAPTAKRGVYPLHGFKLGLYRLPIKLEDPLEIKSVHDGLKKAFEMDAYADRIFATYRWKEQNMKDPDAKGYEEVELSVTVEIVSAEATGVQRRLRKSSPALAGHDVSVGALLRLWSISLSSQVNPRRWP